MISSNRRRVPWVQRPTLADPCSDDPPLPLPVCFRGAHQSLSGALGRVVLHAQVQQKLWPTYVSGCTGLTVHWKEAIACFLGEKWGSKDTGPGTGSIRWDEPYCVNCKSDLEPPNLFCEGTARWCRNAALALKTSWAETACLTRF